MLLFQNKGLKLMRLQKSKTLVLLELDQDYLHLVVRLILVLPVYIVLIVLKLGQHVRHRDLYGLMEFTMRIS